MLNPKEEKLIALKVMLSVQNISDLAALSKNFKSKNIKASATPDVHFTGLVLVTPHLKELSWLLAQMQYIFQNNSESFLFLCESLKLELAKEMSAKQITDYLLKESGKLLK